MKDKVYFWQETPIKESLGEYYVSMVKKTHSELEELYIDSTMTVSQLEKNFENRVKKGEASGIEYNVFRRYQEIKLLLKCEIALKNKDSDNSDLLNELNDFFDLCNVRYKKKI